MTKEIIAGYDITSYATDPGHLSKVNAILAYVKQRGVEGYIQHVNEIDPVPVIAQMVLDAAAKHDVDSALMVAIMMNDSRLGSRGKGSRTHNPGNVGNDDTGKLVDWGTWEAGVEAVARWLSKHKVK